MRTWVGLTWIWEVSPAGGRYCSYLLPKQGGGTFQIRVNPSQVPQELGHPVQDALFADELEFPSVAKKLQRDSKGMAQPAETILFFFFVGLCLSRVGLLCL